MIASSSTTWQSGNDPCPDGWRVPTKAEYDALLTASTETWGSSGGINGMTFTLTNGTLFFPAGGYRTGPSPLYQTSAGHYWSSEQSGAITAYRLRFTSTPPGYTGTGVDKFHAFTIRCVRPYSIEVNPVGEVLVEGTTADSRAVYWAKSNVGTSANSFEAAETTYGGYYRWDDATPYTYTGGTEPSTINSTAETWQPVNNPCPAGWEVPTRRDYLDLLAAASTTKTWTTIDDINGASLPVTNGTLFFPAGGYRYGSTSTDQNVGCLYLTSEQADANNSYRFFFASTWYGDVVSGNKSNARLLRCVRPKIE